jgi:EAL domain-containing protein (putative c-di-GMP-specific phosphodiesterase class I)
VPGDLPVAPEGVERAHDWPELLADACRGIGIRSVYQPIVDVARGIVAGYEALARFESGPANPEHWFAAARDHGVEAELDAAALRSALRCRADLPRNTFLSVNVAPTSLVSRPVREVWAAETSLSGLVIELTEQNAIKSYAALEPDLDRLRAAGALIAVDDAGAGYAGLNHLLMLRPEIIKLDRALITDLDLDETKRALVEMLGTFASRVDAWVLAEGIERSGELDALAALGIPLAQGYYLARPGPSWVPLEPQAADQLATRTRPAPSHTLRSILDAAPWVHRVEELGHDLVGVFVLVDADDRPVAVITPDNWTVGLVEPGLRMNVNTPIDQAAQRAMTRGPSTRFSPLLCTDGAGRYLGVVHIERLVHALAAIGQGAGQAATGPVS